MVFPRLRAALLCLLVLPLSGTAQQLEEQVEVELVQVDLVAMDSEGEMVTDLTEKDFVIKEDGKLRNILHFYNAATETSRYPLAISFLVDTSKSMEETVAGLTRIEVAVNAAELVMNQLNDTDRIELIEFNNKPVALVPFTSDLDSVWNRFEELKSQEANTAMHDAVVFALERVREQSGRRVVVIFSDGMDSASKSVEKDVLDAIRKSGATIIAFYAEFAGRNFPGAMGGSNPMSNVRIGAGEDLLREYSEESGGRFFSFTKEAELAKAMEDFRSFLQSQYTLTYTPEETGKRGWRKIKVECKRKGIRLRYREGYWAN